MKKALKGSILTGLALVATVLTSCGQKRHEIEFWSSFGASYTQYLDQIVNNVKEAKGYDIEHISHKGYDQIKKDVSQSIPTGKYPNLVTGYPDHFAQYMNNNLILPLNKYIDAYNQEHGCDLLKDYFPNYLNECKTLDVGDNGEEIISCLPFNKSTEVMGYNSTFVEFCKFYIQQFSKTGDEWDLGVIPSTWQEWAIKGPKYREVMDYLAKQTNDNGQVVNNHYGKKVYGKQDAEGKAYDFVVQEKANSGANYVDTLGAANRGEGTKLLLDFENVDSKDTRVIAWDSTDNMFITLIRQWGAEYTKLPVEELAKKPKKRTGHIRFLSSENKPKVQACMDYFKALSDAKIFGTPSQLGVNGYSSDAFKINRVMFMLCSSGGLSYNVAKWEYRFRVAPLPYYDDGTDVSGMQPGEAKQHVRKYVISQGADIALTKYGNNEETYKKAFDTMVDLTRGDNQAIWCINTGYYPCSKSASGVEEDGETPISGTRYQNFLNDTEIDPDFPAPIAYREGSVINQQYYMDPSQGWEKFVDPAFKGSSEIREKIVDVFLSYFKGTSFDNCFKDLTTFVNSERQIVIDAE